MSTVLMIEDDETCRELVKNSLAGKFKFTFVATLRDAIDVLGKDVFDAVAIDPGLPDSESSKTFDVIKARVKDAGFKPAIIVCSGHNDPDFIYDVIQKNASGFYDKNKLDRNCSSLARMLDVAIKTNELSNTIDRAKMRLED